MSAGRSLAIVGATGAVGRELLVVLAEREFPVRSLRALASPRSAGATVSFRGRPVPVEPMGPGALEGVELALFSAGAGVAREYAAAAVRAGAVVIDNSSAFRMQEDVPLVVPECNLGALRSHRGVIANPNCSTILLVLALRPLHRLGGLRRVVVSTYQAASGAGARAVEELRATTAARLAGQPVVPSALPHALAFNVFPHVDVFGPDGYTREEDKMLLETRKILGLPELRVEATCVRVPVERCHAESVTVELERAVEPAAARAALAEAPGVVVEDDPENALMPLPDAWAGRDPVAVGRIRCSRVFETGLTFWLVGDQLRKGAALNAVQIAENL